MDKRSASGAESQGSTGQADYPDQQRQGRCEGGVVAGVASRQRRQGRSGEQCSGRLRTDRHLRGRPEHRVDQCRSDDRPQPSYRRQPGHLGIGHDLWQQVRGNRHAGHEITAQPAAFVVDDPVQARRPPEQTIQWTPPATALLAALTRPEPATASLPGCERRSYGASHPRRESDWINSTASRAGHRI